MDLGRIKQQFWPKQDGGSSQWKVTTVRFGENHTLVRRGVAAGEATRGRYPGVVATTSCYGRHLQSGVHSFDQPRRTSLKAPRRVGAPTSSDHPPWPVEGCLTPCSSEMLCLPFFFASTSPLASYSRLVPTVLAFEGDDRLLDSCRGAAQKASDMTPPFSLGHLSCGRNDILEGYVEFPVGKKKDVA
jgi:hypothetical protein